tara:strand:- start:153 stop:575 length:423 start_codon:yes stop_codon:yes gene_type:complete
MAFKLGTGTQPQALNGVIRKKLGFNKTGGDSDISVPGTPVIRTSLEEGVAGEANMDGTIYINEKILPGSKQEEDVIRHEMRHATDIRTGKLEYGDNYVKYNGERFPRETRNGIDMIMFNGEWKQAGNHGFPWEDDANNGY